MSGSPREGSEEILTDMIQENFPKTQAEPNLIRERQGFTHQGEQVNTERDPATVIKL